MISANASNKIVDLPQRHVSSAGGLDHLGELLKRVRGISLKRIEVLINSLFENIDDALFDLADKAENNAVQTCYFDGMREVRKRRQFIERMYQEQLNEAFIDFAAGKLHPKAEGTSHQNSTLTLVEDSELEESLAVASSVAKAENRLAPQLFAVNQRLSLIRGGSKVDMANNPIAPASVCQAFRLAMHELDLNDQSRLLIYKLFDRYVMSNLDALYDDVNALLIQAGVLPQIRRRGPQGDGHALGSKSSPDSSVAVGEPDVATGEIVDVVYPAYPQQYDPAAAQLQAEIYSTVCSLLARRRLIVPPGEQRSSNYLVGTPSLAPADLLSALTWLQNQAVVTQSCVPLTVDAAQIVQQIKRALLGQAGKLRGNEKVHVAGADEDTIDLVGMLFEFVLQDRNLLPQMQALLGRLQIPFLKIALVDKRLFAQKSHPARQLLDTLAQACVGWSEESDRDHRLHEKVRQTVESLLKEFDGDLSIFERIRGDFERFLETNKKRADLAEQRAAEAARGCERLHSARRISAREILKRIEGKKLPDIVHNVLTRPWANFLVLTLLRRGEDSEEWRDALRFADEFVWSAAPKNTNAARRRLKDVLPELEGNLRHSLKTVAYHENDVKQLMQELNVFYGNIINGASPVLVPPSTSATDFSAEGAKPIELVSKAAATAAAVESAIEEIVMRVDAEEAAAKASYADEDMCLKQAKEIPVGTWVEFTSADTGAKERAKLSWKSPISSKYLFVNRRGLKVSDTSVFSLAADIRRGAALILEEVPLFDRALDAIIASLKAHAPSGREPLIQH
jgi:hypothetical protein